MTALFIAGKRISSARLTMLERAIAKIHSVGSSVRPSAIHVIHAYTIRGIEILFTMRYGDFSSFLLPNFVILSLGDRPKRRH